MGNMNVPKAPENKPHFVDLFSPEMENKFLTEGKMYRRKIEPIRGVEKVEKAQLVETILPDGTVEASVEAKPGQYIITGAKGEKFVFDQEKVDNLYNSDGKGGYTPKERKIIVLPNPFGKEIETIAPWGTPEEPEYTRGSKKCVVVAALDESGKMTEDRYIIGDEELLLSNYEPIEPESSK